MECSGYLWSKAASTGSQTGWVQAAQGREGTLCRASVESGICRVLLGPGMRAKAASLASSGSMPVGRFGGWGFGAGAASVSVSFVKLVFAVSRA